MSHQARPAEPQTMLPKPSTNESRDVGRTLSSDATADNLSMTDESCIAYCSQKGYIYAGAEFGHECCE